MPIFPKLKTGAVSQYPARRTVEFKNQCLRFVDGTEQRYRDSQNALGRWVITLNNLDEAEIAALEQFFVSVQGAFGTFEFVDPWDGTTHSNCVLRNGELDFDLLGEMNHSTSLVIAELRP